MTITSTITADLRVAGGTPTAWQVGPPRQRPRGWNPTSHDRDLPHCQESHQSFLLEVVALGLGVGGKVLPQVYSSSKTTLRADKQKKNQLLLNRRLGVSLPSPATSEVTRHHYVAHIATHVRRDEALVRGGVPNWAWFSVEGGWAIGGYGMFMFTWSGSCWVRRKLGYMGIWPKNLEN